MLEPLEVEIRTLHAILGSERDPDGRAFAPLADAYRRAGQPRKALGLLTDGLTRLPDFASGHVVAARLYAEQGLLEEGELAARRALELDSENVSALAVLVRVLDATGRTGDAADAYATLEELEPEILHEEGVSRPEPVLDVADLAPEAAEEVLDVASLAPEEDVVDVAALAPEEDVVDVAALAPDEDEVVLEVADLAPEGEEEVLDVTSLAPEEEVFDVAALAPEPEEAVFDVAALAPEPEEAAIDVAALAPGEDEAVLEVADLAPEVAEEVLDVASLAPEEEVVDMAALAPEEATVDVAAVAPEPEEGPSEPYEPRKGSAPRIYTRTLGELYAKQGFLDRAVEVFRQLRSEHPEDDGIAQRLRTLEAQMDGSLATDDAAEASERMERARARDEELEALARDLAEHRERQPEIDTPFAWTNAEDSDEDGGPDGEGSGPRIGDYFQDLLGYRSGGGAE